MKLKFYALLVLSIALLGLKNVDDDDGGDDFEPERNMWHTEFTEMAVGEELYANTTHKILNAVAQAGQDLIRSGHIPKSLFAKDNLYADGIGPSLQGLRYSGDSDQRRGVFTNIASENSSISELIDVSNLVVFYPDTSQAIAVKIPDSTGQFKVHGQTFDFAAYYVLKIDEAVRPSPYGALLFAVYHEGYLDRLIIGSLDPRNHALHLIANYPAGESRNFSYRFREHIDWAQAKKDRASIYRPPTYNEAVLPAVLEERELRKRLLEFARALASDCSKGLSD